MTAVISAIVENALNKFRDLSPREKITELDQFASLVEASRCSAGGALQGQTRAETDAILSGMMQILNENLPASNQVNLSRRDVVAEDVVFAARDALMRGGR